VVTDRYKMMTNLLRLWSISITSTVLRKNWIAAGWLQWDGNSGSKRDLRWSSWKGGFI